MPKELDAFSAQYLVSIFGCCALTQPVFLLSHDVTWAYLRRAAFQGKYSSCHFHFWSTESFVDVGSGFILSALLLSIFVPHFIVGTRLLLLKILCCKPLPHLEVLEPICILMPQVQFQVAKHLSP